MKSLLLNVSRSVHAGTGCRVPLRCSRPAVSRRNQVLRRAGFTLIELMIVVAIVAILAAIAYPSYTQYILKTRRTAAKACLSEYANYMERYYTTNLTYVAAPDPGLDCQGPAQIGPYYGIVASGLAASAYKLTATPKDAQRSDSCGALGLDQTGARTPSGTTCW